MTEKILSIKDRKGEGKEGVTSEISQRILKDKIKKHINNIGIDMINLSENTNINIFALIYLLYCPFSNIKLSKGIMLCNALNLKLSDLFN